MIDCYSERGIVKAFSYSCSVRIILDRISAELEPAKKKKNAGLCIGGGVTEGWVNGSQIKPTEGRPSLINAK